MAELQGRVRERVRAELVRHGASTALEDPKLFAEIDDMLRAAIERSQPSTWRLETAIKYETHRGGAGAPIIFIKRRLLMPVIRWFYEFTRDNFERQRRINQVLFACVQELAIETARLRHELRALSRTEPPDRP
jgi:hypothetical protein